ncbi:MAG TPA: MraY family glycosyltransferase [Ilumatobacteraceae bacterium]|jgi:UDP-GlcNAc:undecaprenyl-phosphate GlcNAc-1-phosphate transferase
MPSTTSYLLIGLVAAVATFVCTPVVAHVARRVGWVAEPGERKIHKVATPDVGGIAMFVGLVAALAAARLNDRFDTIFARNSDEPRGLLLAALVMFGVGLIDDIRDMSAPAKVVGTIAAAGVLTYYGVTMFYFRVPFVDVFTVSDDWVLLVTVVWLLGMSQAINLIDGLDGLAAGIVAIGAAAFFIYSLRLADPTVRLLPSPSIGPLVAIITVGICVGFLPHNFNPARIFMGDGGALLLGLLLAVSTSVVGGRADPNLRGYAGQTYFFLAPLFIPLFILGVPIVDTMFAIIRRATSRQGVATADKRHLHHRLMEMGHGQRRSVIILWAWTALLSALVLYPVLTQSFVSYVPIGAAMLGLVLYTMFHPQIRRNRAAPAEIPDVGLESETSPG